MQAPTFELQDFQQDVITASQARPVLVDFWAPWCGPCRTLGPILEKLAAEQADLWTLVKINTDQHPAVSAQFGVRGIPAVKLFVEGNVVDEFTGALPEYAIRQWLEKALPSEAKQRLAEAEHALLTDDPERAEALLEQVLAEEPTHPKARILLAQVVLFDNPGRAETLAQATAAVEPSYLMQGEAVRTLAALLQQNPDDLPAGEGRGAYARGLEALKTQDFDAALTAFIEVVRTDRYYADDAARRACVALFNLLTPEHPMTRKHRRTFDMWLY